MRSAADDMEQCRRIGGVLLAAEFRIADALRAGPSAVSYAELLIELRDKLKAVGEVAATIARGIGERDDRAIPRPPEPPDDPEVERLCEEARREAMTWPENRRLLTG